MLFNNGRVVEFTGLSINPHSMYIHLQCNISEYKYTFVTPSVLFLDILDRRPTADFDACHDIDLSRHYPKTALQLFLFASFTLVLVYILPHSVMIYRRFINSPPEFQWKCPGCEECSKKTPSPEGYLQCEYCGGVFTSHGFILEPKSNVFISGGLEVGRTSQVLEEEEKKIWTCPDSACGVVNDVPMDDRGVYICENCETQYNLHCEPSELSGQNGAHQLVRSETAASRFSVDSAVNVGRSRGRRSERSEEECQCCCVS